MLIELILLLLEGGSEFFDILLFKSLVFDFLNFSFQLNNASFECVALSSELRYLELFGLNFRFQDLCIIGNASHVVLVPATSGVACMTR